MAIMRLQKVLAAAGMGSRRACEDLIRDGLVRVNGEKVRALPCLVDPATDRVEVDKRPIQTERPIYIMLHKPRGVFCTNADPAGRTRAIDLLVGVKQRVFPIGRLDADTSGLLLMTNDGELANRLTHPRYQVSKTYIAQVDGWMGDEDAERLRRGVWGSEGKQSAERIKVLSHNKTRSVIEIVIKEGRSCPVRRMLASLGHKVRSLAQVKIGALELSGIGPGRWRLLTQRELNYLRKITGPVSSPAV